MLNDFVIVESAVSAFNNAALWMPAFLWWAILAMPLFVVVWKHAHDFMKLIGWNSQNISNKATMWVAGLTCAWTVLFGGNYSVLRDSLSVLPMMTATILFLTMLFISSHLQKQQLPKMNWWRWGVVIVSIIMIGMSDTHAWWGPLLQIGAIVLGYLLGVLAGGRMRPFAGTVLIMMMVAIAILMQPEFFRFGQLGNLTIVHLLTVLVMGGACMMTIAIQNIRTRAKINHSIYVKLKWLMRVVCALGIALFILTEAVPVFISTMIAIFISIAMSVWHQASVNEKLGDKTFAIALMVFGAIITVPVVTVIGILYWASVPDIKFLNESKRLL